MQNDLSQAWDMKKNNGRATVFQRQWKPRKHVEHATLKEGEVTVSRTGKGQ